MRPFHRDRETPSFFRLDFGLRLVWSVDSDLVRVLNLSVLPNHYGPKNPVSHG